MAEDGGFVEWRPRPVPWTLGKFSAFGTLAGRFAWHRIVGA
jgi:hypothetical protein